MKSNTAQSLQLASCTFKRVEVFFRRLLLGVKGGILVSDLPAGVPRQRVNWQLVIGTTLTVVSMAAAGFQYINSVNAKADYALAQISEIKQNQRQTAQDNRSDLQQVNAKLDNLTLLVGRLGTTSNGKY